MAAIGLPGGLTQAHRLLRLHTPLGVDALFAEDLEVWEGICPMAGPALGDAIDDTAAGSWADRSPPPGWAFDASLGPVRVGLRLVVHAVAPNVHLELKALIGQPALVELRCEESRTDLRPWHGHIVGAALMGSDGGLARYRLVIEPWLAALGHRIDSWVFQDLSVPQIIDRVFAALDGQGSLKPAWRWDLADASAYAPRSLCIQYQESDLDFVRRLLQEEGLFCWWEHTGDLASAGLGSHCLVIADHNGAIRPGPRAGVRFTGSEPEILADSLTRWTSVERIVSARVGLRSRDHRELGERSVEAVVGNTRPPSATMNELEVVDQPGAYAYEDVRQGQRLVNRQAEVLAAVRTRAVAAGSWRGAQVGTSFTLSDHPRHDGTDLARDTFVLLAVQHRVRNDLRADEAARFVGLAEAIMRDQARVRRLDPGDEAPRHQVAILVQPKAVPVRIGGADPWLRRLPPQAWPGLLGRNDAGRRDALPSLFDARAVAAFGQPDVRLGLRPTVRGTQTALVVGGPTGDLQTDRDGRIRLQFHWQRGARSSHRLDGTHGDNAPASAASFTWVRVGQSLAGRNYGAVFTPRIGQEVLVAFIAGDIDRPVVIGSVYNGQGLTDAQGNQVTTGAAQASGNAPAWFPGQQPAGPLEGHRHGAVMLGHKSQELGASRSGQGGFNQLVFDDSVAGHRIELSSTTRASRLQLGGLLQQQGNQRLAPRGHGLEVATTAHGALRAGRGLLVSAHVQTGSTGVGQQLEAHDPAAVLQSAHQRVHALAASAQAHNARLKDEPALTGARWLPGSPQMPVGQGLQRMIDGLRTTDDAPARRVGPDARPATIDGGFGSVVAWDRPDLVVAAPSGIGFFTPAAAVVAAGSNLGLSAAEDLQWVAQGSHSVAAREGVVLYTGGAAGDAARPAAETGLRLHAASGSVHVSSDTGASRLTASGRVEVSSSKASVLVASPLQVLLAAAGAAVRVESAGITLQAPGKVSFKAGSKVLAGPAHASVRFQQARGVDAGRVDFNDAFVVTNEAGAPLANRVYEIIREDGGVLRGMTDARGRIQQQVSFKGERVRVIVKGHGRPGPG